MTTDEALTILRTDPVARDLLASANMARLAYTWRDGSPRVVPMWFQWTGAELLMGAPPNSPKMKVLGTRPQVAVSIDGVQWPYQWLTVRGTATVQVASEPLPFREYVMMAQRYLGEAGGEQFLTALRQTFSAWSRIAIQPQEVRVLDFQGRFPGAWSGGSHGT
ncbi:MAG TPA: pyridoxamine 5'-phosphate oxidase family protein [Dehalococcoidia bacterium]|nr:pyridoxamine 5'-phosphate oxidase family protein [Dehalococcoidia bacterium]